MSLVLVMDECRVGAVVAEPQVKAALAFALETYAGAVSLIARRQSNLGP